MKEYVKKSTAKALRSKNRALKNGLNVAITTLDKISTYPWSGEVVNCLKHIAREGAKASMRQARERKEHA